MWLDEIELTGGFLKKKLSIAFINATVSIMCARLKGSVIHYRRPASHDTMTE